MPPPPPPPPAAPRPPPPPAGGPKLGGGGGGANARNALLDSIHGGAKLKKVQTNDRSSPQVGGVKPSGGGAGGSGSGNGGRSSTGSGGSIGGGMGGLGGLFAGGMPQLRPAGQRGAPRTGGAMKPPGARKPSEPSPTPPPPSNHSGSPQFSSNQYSGPPQPPTNQRSGPPPPSQRSGPPPPPPSQRSSSTDQPRGGPPPPPNSRAGPPPPPHRGGPPPPPNQRTASPVMPHRNSNPPPLSSRTSMPPPPPPMERSGSISSQGGRSAPAPPGRGGGNMPPPPPPSRAQVPDSPPPHDPSPHSNYSPSPIEPETLEPDPADPYTQVRKNFKKIVPHEQISHEAHNATSPLSPSQFRSALKPSPTTSPRTPQSESSPADPYSEVRQTFKKVVPKERTSPEGQNTTSFPTSPSQLRKTPPSYPNSPASHQQSSPSRNFTPTRSAHPPPVLTSRSPQANSTYSPQANSTYSPQANSPSHYSPHPAQVSSLEPNSYLTVKKSLKKIVPNESQEAAPYIQVKKSLNKIIPNEQSPPQVKDETSSPVSPIPLRSTLKATPPPSPPNIMPESDQAETYIQVRKSFNKIVPHERSPPKLQDATSFPVSPIQSLKPTPASSPPTVLAESDQAETYIQVRKSFNKIVPNERTSHETQDATPLPTSPSQAKRTLKSNTQMDTQCLHTSASGQETPRSLNLTPVRSAPPPPVPVSKNFVPARSAPPPPSISPPPPPPPRDHYGESYEYDQSYAPPYYHDEPYIEQSHDPSSPHNSYQNLVIVRNMITVVNV